MRTGKAIFVTMVLSISLFQISFAELEFHGFFRNHSAFRTAEPNDAMLLRNRMRLNSELWGDNVYGFASVDFLSDIVTGDDSKLNLREAYLDIYGNWVDFRIGKQQVVWGKADGYFINDIVNPLDLSLFLLQDFEDIRIATSMLNTKLHYGNHSLELLVIPEFKPMNINFDGDWAFNRPDSFTAAINMGGGIMNLNLPINYQEDILPQSSLKNMEYGLKLNSFVFGTDISLIYLKAREDKPIMQKEIVINNLGIPSAVNLYPSHPWFCFYGMNFSRPLGMFVLRGEGGYYPSRHFDYVPENQAEMMISNFLLTKPFIQGMLGVDYQLTGSINVAVQGIQERILNYENSMKFNDEINQLGSLMVNASLFNETVLPMWLVLYNFTNDSYLSRIMVDWKYSDSFTITAGTDVLGGGSDANSSGQFDFGQFDKNDNVYLKLKYSF